MLGHVHPLHYIYLKRYAQANQASLLLKHAKLPLSALEVFFPLPGILPPEGHMDGSRLLGRPHSSASLFNKVFPDHSGALWSKVRGAQEAPSQGWAACSPVPLTQGILSSLKWCQLIIYLPECASGCGHFSSQEGRQWCWPSSEKNLETRWAPQGVWGMRMGGGRLCRSQAWPPG
jgi:hypothetical protein